MKTLKFYSFPFLLICISLACNFQPQSNSDTSQQTDSAVQTAADYVEDKDYEEYAVATFAGGCFWCTEASFERIEGVYEVISGYSGGEETMPTYEQVSNGRTHHAEAIQVYYDTSEIDYATLLKVFFVAHDPTQLNRQGPDVGPHYRSAIFYRNATEKEQIDEVTNALNESGKFNSPIVTEVVEFEKFWVAESYHQNYYEQHPENPYIRNVSRPKVEKVEKTFSHILKAPYR